MKQIASGYTLKGIFTLFMLALVQTALWAQEEGSGSGSSSSGSGSSSSTTIKSVTTSTETSGWYTSPWVWVVGAAVFILLLVALLRGGSSNRSERVTVTKSTRAD